MTAQDFIAFYPQFASYASSPVLAEYVRQANARFALFGADAEEARRLYTAHSLTRYLSALPPEAAPGEAVPAAALAEAGVRREITGKRAGEVSVTYAAGESAAAGGLPDLGGTVFGSRLLLLLRLHSRTEYVP